MDAWLGGTEFAKEDAFHAIARCAFGDLYLYGERTGQILDLDAVASTVIQRSVRVIDFDRRIRSFFGTLSRDACDAYDENGDELFPRASRTLGRLKHDEIYGFVPALALGGPARLANLKKVKAIEHLVFLAQLSELRLLES